MSIWLRSYTGQANKTMWVAQGKQRWRGVRASAIRVSKASWVDSVQYKIDLGRKEAQEWRVELRLRRGICKKLEVVTVRRGGRLSEM